MTEQELYAYIASIRPADEAAMAEPPQYLLIPKTQA